VKDSSPRVPIKLGASSGIESYTNGQFQGGRTDVGEKRKSWLKRRFSKKS